VVTGEGRLWTERDLAHVAEQPVPVEARRGPGSTASPTTGRRTRTRRSPTLHQILRGSRIEPVRAVVEARGRVLRRRCRVAGTWKVPMTSVPVLPVLPGG